jgi:hypothetical protein
VSTAANERFKFASPLCIRCTSLTRTSSQLFNNLALRACSRHLRALSLRSELYDPEAVKEKAAATTLVMPLFAVKNTHVRAMLDAALVTDAEERIGLDKVSVCAA